MRISKELQVGKAGEYLVCADLILKGYVAFPSEQGLPYDVLLDNGKRLLRIQVKTTSNPRTIPQRAQDSVAYIFNVKRHGKNNTSRYDFGEVDIFALVCLDTRKIGYIINCDMPDTINLRCDSLKGTYYDEKGIAQYADVCKLKGTMSQTDIGKKLGLHVSIVNRMCKDGYVPFTTKAKYFSDIERDAKWFSNIS